MSPGHQLIDYVYIEDVISAIEIATSFIKKQSKPIFERYAVRGLNPIPLKELVQTFERVSQIKCNIEWGGRPYKAREMMKIPNFPLLPNWFPKTSLTKGLTHVIAEKKT